METTKPHRMAYADTEHLSNQQNHREITQTSVEQLNPSTIWQISELMMDKPYDKEA